MLKIAMNHTPSEQRWVLQGRLAGPWIAELRSNWEMARPGRRGRRCVVDLSDVTFIDELGQEVLRGMMMAGAEFIACGVCTRYVLEKLEQTLRPGQNNPSIPIRRDRDCVEWRLEAGNGPDSGRHSRPDADSRAQVPGHRTLSRTQEEEK